ncbi:unnamed protein product [Phaedon cochleariae]|uniref:RING-type domain-containing protein n=1 Tax=Phaedon cochleariae TaxID=80249 RepID=A0A9P0GY05_PHACE|nr:unnamed protein product [Phaedon cochleariae]
MNQALPFRPNNYLDRPDNGPKKPAIEESQQTPRTPTPIENYLTYEDRLITYRNWPNKEVTKEDLASAGFIYIGRNDVVCCPFCKVEGYCWQSGDNPMGDHRVWSPNCPFVRSQSQLESDHAETSTRAVDTCGLYGVEVLPNSLPEDGKKIDLQRLGIQESKGPQHQDKALFESRVETFQNWPRSLKQRPADLAAAGFFYTGVGDQTLCFYCGGGLKDWEEGDDPWEQHALWFGKCVFLNLKKGKEFIERVKARSAAEVSLPSTSGVEAKEEEAAEAPKAKGVVSEEAEKTLCKICYKNELAVVFLPCGHIVACVDCASSLKQCAVCRKPLEATVRAFLS